MIEAELKVLGFELGGDGTLLAPNGSHVTLKRLGAFYRLYIDLGNGSTLAVVVARNALKMTTEGEAAD
jgi:hypothetical protein